MKRILAIAAAAIAFVASAESPEPKIPQIKDPNPYANYGDAMRSVKGVPMAVEWQDANAKALEKATSRETLAQLAQSEESMSALLAQVKEAYKTDPVVATQIAAFSQMAMCRKCPKAPKLRARWTASLVKAAKGADDAYRKMFFLDQLRWCGHADEAAQAREIGAKSGDKAVADFAELVAKELEAAK